MRSRTFVDIGVWPSLALLGALVGCGPSDVESSDEVMAMGGGAEATASMAQAIEGNDPDALLVPDWVKQPPVPPALVKFVGFLKEAYPVANLLWGFLNKGPTLADLLEQMKQDIIDEVRRVHNADLESRVESLINRYNEIARNPTNATSLGRYGNWLDDSHDTMSAIRAVMNGPDVQGGYNLSIPLNVLSAMHLTMLRGSADVGVEPFDQQSMRDVLRDMKQTNYDFVGYRWTYLAGASGFAQDTRQSSKLWKSNLFAAASGAGRCEQRIAPDDYGFSSETCPINCNLLTGSCSPWFSCTTYGSAELAACLRSKRAQVSAKFEADRVVIAVQRALAEIIRLYPDPIANTAAPGSGDVTLAGPMFRAHEAPISVSSAGARVDVAYTSTSAKLQHISFVNNQPGVQWGRSQESTKSLPAARAMGTDLFWGFYRGNSDSVYQYERAGANSAGTPWQGVPPTAGLNLAGPFVENPAVTPSNTPFLVALGTDRQAWINKWYGTHWGGWWKHQGVLFQSSPVAVSPEPGRLDYFGGDMTGLVGHGWATPNGAQLQILDGNFGGLAATSWGPNRIDLFGVGEDRAVWHRYWNGSTWSQWRSLGGMVTSKPAVVSWAPGRIDVFARGTDAALWHAWCDGQGCDNHNWIAWEYMGGYILGNPVVTSPGPGKLAVFVHGGSNGLYRKVFDNGWQPSLHGFDGIAFDVVTTIDRGIYRLELTASGKCLDVNGAGTADGTNILQWHCNGGGAQAFELQGVGNGLFRLVNTNSHKCVDVAGGGSADGTNVQLATCNGTGSQAFSLELVGDPNDGVRLVNVTGKCIEVFSNPHDAGSNVRIGTCMSKRSAQNPPQPPAPAQPLKRQLWKLIRI